MTATIAGKDAGVHPEEAAKAQAAAVKSTYEAKSFTVPTGGGDHSAKDDEGMFTKLKNAHHITVITDTAVSIKLVSKDDPTPDPIPISPAFPFSWHSNEFSDVLFVEDGSATPAIILVIA